MFNEGYVTSVDGVEWVIVGDSEVGYIQECMMYAVRASMIYRDFPGALPYEYEESEAAQ